ncbi:hypothetical protein ACSBR1_042974 [Camellia fascicularis]
MAGQPQRHLLQLGWSVFVRWDENSTIPSPERVSPWKIEPALTTAALNPLPMPRLKRPRSSMMPSSPDSSVLTREVVWPSSLDDEKIDMVSPSQKYGSDEWLSSVRHESTFTDLFSGFGAQTNSSHESIKVNLPDWEGKFNFLASNWSITPSALSLNLLDSIMKAHVQSSDRPYHSRDVRYGGFTEYSLLPSQKPEQHQGNWLREPPLQSYLHIPTQSRGLIPRPVLIQQPEAVKPKDGNCRLFGIPLISNHVHKRGIALGRPMDLTKFSNYEELIAELDQLFEFNGELKARSKNWLIVFTDDEGDMMLQTYI